MNDRKMTRYIVGLIILWVVVVATLFGMAVLIQYKLENPTNISTKVNETKNNLVLYDTNVLEESNMFCPFCGSNVIAVNKEIVCRNETCEVYGLPVRILQYDDYMNTDIENNLDK